MYSLTIQAFEVIICDFFLIETLTLKFTCDQREKRPEASNKSKGTELTRYKLVDYRIMKIRNPNDLKFSLLYISASWIISGVNLAMFFALDSDPKYRVIEIKN